MTNHYEMLKTTLVLCCLVSVTYAALSIAPLKPKPEKFKDIEGCYIEELDTVVPVGVAAKSIKHCMEYRCGAKHVRKATCGVTIAIPPCTLEEDKGKPYPDCCPRVVCP